MSCRVVVEQGVLEGAVCTSHFGQAYCSFEGIPYARPPVGKLRFRAPQEPECWSGVRDATKPGSKCAQINPYGTSTLEGSEDCLYLNVYTPRLPADELAKLPVLFFVHGGRFLVGYGDYYRPDFLIRHDVILVTINYRLHVLGFLCLNTPDVPGNAGMKDTVMALKWVKKNIHNFNGDPANITAFGESAGSALVTSYLTSRMAKGLCNKIISQSGNLLSDLFMVEEDEEAKARNICEIMGKQVTDQKSLTDCLTDAPVEELLEATVVAELSRPPAVINAYFLPVVERKFEGVDRFFEEDPHVSIKGGKFEAIPILLSLCSHEGALFLQSDGNGGVIFEDNFQYFVPRYLRIKPDSVEAKKFANSIRAYYFKDKKLTQEMKAQYLDFATDVYFGRDTIMFVEAVAKLVDIYVCMFSYNGGMNTGTMRRLGLPGASHGDLVQYMFFRENKIGRCKQKDMDVVDALTEAWCNFARTGKPTWRNQKQDWLPYTVEQKTCLCVDKDIIVTTCPNYDRYKFWFDLMSGRSKL